MPYIPDDQRHIIDATTPGQLNYKVTCDVLRYLRFREGVDGRLTYAAFNDAVGALECAKLELYRRLGGPLEEDAIARNGDLAGYARPSRLPR